MRNKNKIGIVRAAEADQVILRPNEMTSIEGYTDREVKCGQTFVMIHESEESSLPDVVQVVLSGKRRKRLFLHC